jgi:serine protease Do
MMGEGSGFVVSPDGLIVTNAHVAGGADKIEVTFKDGRKLTATLKGVDEKTDLALLKVDGGRAPLPYVVFGDSSKVRPGDKVIAGRQPVRPRRHGHGGIVSATGREIGSGPYDDYIQVDAPINRGNSGGPTFNLRGEVVGVNTAIFSPSGGSVGIGFAIAANLAKSVVDDLKGRRHGRARLPRRRHPGRGRGPRPRPEARPPARRAGEPGRDRQPGREGRRQARRRGARLQRHPDRPRGPAQPGRGRRSTPGASGRLTIWRDGPRADPLGPGRRDADPAGGGGRRRRARSAEQPRLGLGLAAITPEARERLNLEGEVEGVLVTQVTPQSPADEKGIEPGDVIVSVNQEPVREPRQLIEAVRKAGSAGDKQVLLLILRDGQQRFEAVPLATS